MQQRQPEKSYESVLGFLKGKVKERFSQKVIYHYTSFRTFPVFFERNADLYCTHFAALNDGAEIRQGWEMAIRFLNNKFRWQNEKCNMLWRYYQRGILESKIVAPWIMSFSSAKDSLGQWIAYTDRVEGGYSLGFNFARLEMLLKRVACNVKKVTVDGEDGARNKEIPYRLYVLPCLYSESDAGLIEELMMDYFGKEKSVFDRVRDSENPDNKDVAKIIAKLILVSSFVKHESFKSEQEIRLIFQPLLLSYDACEFIGGKPRIKSKVAEYANAELCSLLDEIWISPHGDTQVLLSSAKIMAAKHGLNACKIEKSRSPYNGR